MESASKALLIAGAILVTLAVVAVAVAVATRGEETLNEIGDIAINDTLVANQVNKFIKYEGQVTGAQVKQCVSAAIAHNSNLKADEAIYAVTVNVSGGVYVDRDNFINDGGKQGVVNHISTNINNTSSYNAIINYLPNVGTIQQITFISVP